METDYEETLGEYIYIVTEDTDYIAHRWRDYLNGDLSLEDYRAEEQALEDGEMCVWLIEKWTVCACCSQKKELVETFGGQFGDTPREAFRASEFWLQNS